MIRPLAPPMRDYLLGTTHRKDALDGALWEGLRHQLAGRAGADEVRSDPPPPSSFEGRGIVLPPAPSRRDAGREGAEAGAELGAILHDAAGIVRWEPTNPNAEHRSCPSPGNRFTTDLEIAVAGARGTRWFRYLPRDRMLAEIADPDEDCSAGRQDLAIVLRGHVDRCARPYGDLALCLATIEIGAMLAQLLLALGGRGLAVERARFAGDGNTLDPVLHLRVRAPRLAIWLARAPCVPVRLSRSVPGRPEDTGGRLLDDFRTFVSSGAPKPDLFPDGLAVSECEPLLRATSTRSSGRDLQGVRDGRPDGSQLATLLDTVGRLFAAFRGIGSLPVRLDAWLDDPAAAAEWQRRLGDRPAWLHLGDASAPPGSPGYAYPGGAVVLTVSASLDDYTARTGTTALSAMHLAAGIATQIVCIAAAGAGLACRPMRSFDHAVADAALPVDYWSLIQLVVYADRAPNPAFRLAGVSPGGGR